MAGRYFIGLEPNSEFKKKIKSDRDPESTHLTLSYLGSKDPVELPFIVNALKEIAQEQSKFPVHVPFYGKFREKLPYAGAELSSDLSNLRESLDNNIYTRSVDNRTFIPHVTISAAQLPDNQDLSFDANNLILYQSNPNKPGNYDKLVTIPFQDPSVIDSIKNWISSH